MFAVEEHTVPEYMVFLKRLIKFIISYAAVMLVLSAAVFLLSRLAPGDPLQAFYGDALQTMGREEREAARLRLGLDSGLLTQYTAWLKGLLRGDLGMSLKYKMSVLDVVTPLIGNTLLLGFFSFTVIFIAALASAVICTLYEGRIIDRIICRIGTVLYYIPGFWLAVVLVMVFGIWLRWLPSGGAYDIGKSGDVLNRAWHLVLPVTVISAGHFWYYAYIIRSRLLDEMRKDYVLLAEACGLGRGEVLLGHCLLNTAPSILSLMAIAIPHILGGTVVVEAVLTYPGLGSLAVESAKYHDYNLLMVTAMIIGAIAVLGSLAAQAAAEHIDPRMKASGEIQ